MNTTARTQPAARRAPGFRDASMHELFVDCCRIGPAPTRSREVFVIVVTAILLAAILIVVSAGPLYVLTASVIVAAFMVGRWVHGERKVWTPR